MEVRVRKMHLLSERAVKMHRKPKLPGLLSLKNVLFAKKILSKYGILDNYKFDNAAMVFLEKLAGEDTKQSDLKERISFTVRLMLLHQNRGLVAKNISLNKKGLETTLKNHIRVNLSHILFTDRRVYTELSQIYKDNHRFDEMKKRMDRYESIEKRLVYQLHNGQIINPNTLNNQMKKLMELRKFKNTVAEHDFLYVLKKGSLAQKRMAMEVLGKTMNEWMVSNEVTQVKKQKHITEDITRLHLQIEEKNISQSLIYRKEKQLREEKEKEEAVVRRKRTEELHKIKQELELQRTLKIREDEEVSRLKKKMEEQTKQVELLFQQHTDIKNQLMKKENHLSSQVSEQIRSELHLDKMRYGLI